MPKTLKSLYSYNGGEVSPKLDARADQQKYSEWMRTCRNMIPYRTGGLTRAPGTLQVAKAKLAPGVNNYCVNLIRFTFSNSTTFELEFGHQYIRFYSNQQQVESSPGVPYEISSPYTANAGSGSIYDTEVFKLAVCQINDVVYIASPNRAPYILTRIADTNWVLAQVNFFTPPLLDQNATGIFLFTNATSGVVTVWANAPTWASGTSYKIGDAVNSTGAFPDGPLYVCVFPHVSSAAFATDLALGYWEQQIVFTPDNVGGYFEINHVRPAAFVEIDISADGTSSTILGSGTATFNTYGVWTADVYLWRSDDGGTNWYKVATVTSRDDNNATSQIEIIGEALYYIEVDNWVSMGGTTTPRAVFSVNDSIARGTVRVATYAGSGHIVGLAVEEIYSTNSTTLWSEGAWSGRRGYPQAVTSFQQRVIYGGSAYEPQRIWGSVTNDLENFDRSDPSLATSSFAFDLNAPGRGPIQWLIGQSDLFVGLNGAEWVVNSGQTSSNASVSGAAITPTAINAIEQGSFGSAPNVQPAIVGNSAFFVQRQADSLRQIQFNFYTNKYQSQDLCALADHLFISRIAQIAYQARWRHQGLVWAVTKQGTLCGLSYDIDGEIGGWCRRDTGYGQTTPDGAAIPNDNGFESVSVLPGSSGEDDQVWVVANRLVNGVATRFIELVNPFNWEEDFTQAPNAPEPDLNLAYYVDSGAIVTSPGSLTFVVPELANLVGRYVVGLADGSEFGPILVEALGSITLPASIPSTVQTVVVGLPIAYRAKPMRIDMDARMGITQSYVKTISDVFIRVWNSMGGSISNGSEQYPTWVSGTNYTASDNVISPSTQLAYQCLISGVSVVDPANDSTNWAETPKPSYQQPVPIPYVNAVGNPWAVPTLVTVPTDIRITPQNQPQMTADPLYMVVGNDPKPLTVIGIFLKTDVVSTP